MLRLLNVNVINCNANACGHQCVCLAPEHFEIWDNRFARVKKHPETEEEIKLCQEAATNCPKEAIFFK